MNDTNGSEDWRVLCELASKENDPKKMLDLITKINHGIRGIPSEISGSLEHKRVCAQHCSGYLAPGSVRLLVWQSATGLNEESLVRFQGE